MLRKPLKPTASVVVWVRSRAPNIQNSRALLFPFIKDSRTSEFAPATTPRTLVIPTPAWSEGGSLPPDKHWQSTMEVLEGERVVPGPKPAPVYKWIPATPVISFPGGTAVVSGSMNQRKDFTAHLKLDYPYGAEGYEDIIFTIKTNTTDKVTHLGVVGNASTPDREVKYSITSGDKMFYTEITVTARSKSSGLSSSSSFYVNWKGITSWASEGHGGSKDLEKALGIENIKTLVDEICKYNGGAENGGPTSACNFDTIPDEKKFKLCFSAKVHGYNIQTMHNRCSRKVFYARGIVFFSSRW